MGAFLVEDSIETFIGHFLGKMNDIDAMNGPNEQTKTLFQAILMVVLLDTLSRAAHPNLSNDNRNRFITFIESCSAWQDRNRISSWQLMLNLEQKKLTDGRIYPFVVSTVQKWGAGGLLGPEVDPTDVDIAALRGSGREMVEAKDCRYISLLYFYRNSLLHEFREPGYAFYFPEQEDVFYQSVLHGSGQEDRGYSWQLTFPINFLRRLCLSSIWGLCDLLMKEKRDPYQAYPFGSRWKSR